MIIIEEYSVEIIKLILSMTFTGSIISFFLFILKPIIKNKLPKSFQYYMWFSVVIALMLPVSKIIVIPTSNNSLIPIKSIYDITQRVSDMVFEKPINLVLSQQNENEQNIRQITYFPSTAVVLFVFWQLGMLLVLGFNILCYMFYVQRLVKHNVSAERQEIELLHNLLKRKKILRLYKNTIVKTPILIGSFRPTVILTNKKYDDMELRNILMHEIVHMKRHDIFVKWLLIFVGAIHWFNPFVYLVCREMNKACELSCDEAVIKRFSSSEKQQYGDTLIAVAVDSIKKSPFSITLVDDKKNLKERLNAIMKHKQYSKRTVIAASVILITIVCTILGVGTLHSIENEYNYTDDYSQPQEQKHIKEIELRDALRNYDKKNIVEVYSFFNDLDEKITNAYITIVCQEKNPASEMQSEIKSLVSKKLGLDVQNIYIDYIDVETFTSNESRGSK